MHSAVDIEHSETIIDFCYDKRHHTNRYTRCVSDVKGLKLLTWLCY
jgi:hypothetical protein